MLIYKIHSKLHWWRCIPAVHRAILSALNESNRLPPSIVQFYVRKMTGAIQSTSIIRVVIYQFCRKLVKFCRKCRQLQHSHISGWHFFGEVSHSLHVSFMQPTIVFHSSWAVPISAIVLLNNLHTICLFTFKIIWKFIKGNGYRFWIPSSVCPPESFDLRIPVTRKWSLHSKLVSMWMVSIL